MRVQVVMPQLGESIVEGTIVEWHKNVGDAVKKGDELFTITTDKVDTGVPAPEDGVLSEILLGVDAVVSVGQIVASIETDAAAASAAPGAAAPAVEAAPAAPVAEAAPAVAARGAEAAPAADEDGGDSQSLISPVAAKVLKEAGITDTSVIKGSGAQGRILKQDVIDFLAAREGAAASAEVSESPAAAAQRVSTPESQSASTIERPPILQSAQAPVALPLAAGETQVSSQFVSERPPRPQFTLPLIPAGVALDPKPEDRVEPMTPARQLISENLTYARRTAAHCATVWDVDMTRVAAARQRLQREYAKLDVNLTYTPFFLSAIASALQAYPVLNASTDGENIVFRGSITLGIASVWKDGMIVPAIRHVNTLSLLGIARSVNDLQRRVEADEIRPTDLEPATFSISNTGVLGAKFGIPTIFPGQVAVLGIGSIEKRVVVGDDDSLRIRSMATLCLSFDNRVVDFDDADGFMKKLVEYLETKEW